MAPLFSKISRRSLLGAGALCLAFAQAGFGSETKTERSADVLSIGGAITEIIYALGEEERLIARDTTSSYPPEALELPNVGYMRALSPEGVLAVNPGLIISAEGAGPLETLEVLKEANIPFVEIPEGLDAAGVAAKIRAVGSALGVSDKAEDLAGEVEARIDKATQKAQDKVQTPKRAMFVLSVAGGRVMASGENTAADAIIRLSGAVNAMQGFEGYKPVTNEAIGRAAPDVIVMMDRGGDHSASDEELWKIPALLLTPAARDKTVVRVNGLLLLGFGPRLADAVETLSAALYGAGD